jgi:putative NADPH-quinone reductase
MQTKNLLIIAHCPSENLARLRDGLISGAKNAGVHLQVTSRAPLDSDSKDLKTADAIVLLTPENLSYMSGAMKDWFDRIYYPVLDDKQGLPCVAIVRAGHDGTGTVRALQTITTGLRWRWVQDPIILQGSWQETWLDEVTDIGEAIATAVSEGII